MQNLEKIKLRNRIAVSGTVSLLALSLLCLQFSQVWAGTVTKPALAELVKAVEKTPESAPARLALGEAYLSSKDFQKAKENLRLAVRFGKGNAISQKANSLLVGLPSAVVKPKTGPQTRMIASMLGLGRVRGMEGAKPTVIDFYASWAQPCKQLSGVMDKFKTSYKDKVKFMRVDVDDPGSESLLDQYEVSPVPTVVFLNEEGEVVSYSVGFSGENSVKEGLNKILSANAK